jgi:hypothetical protein
MSAFTNNGSPQIFALPATKTEIPPLTETPPNASRPKRCCFDGCKKKLGLLDFACKCGLIHCSLHRASEVHNCSYDYKAKHKDELLKTMSSPVVAKKLDVI